jgi:uncharacterized membrane protein
MNKARIEAFSDGIFAFAATLLVLAFALPEENHTVAVDSQLVTALLGQWPHLVAYLLSFSVIGMMWHNHHALFRLVTKVDRLTGLANLALMAITAFIPFATSVLGAYPGTRTATVLYGLTLTICALAFNALMMHLVRTKSFKANVSEATINQTVHAYRVGLVTYIVATVASFVEPIGGLAFYFLIVGYFLIPHGADADIEELE